MTSDGRSRRVYAALKGVAPLLALSLVGCAGASTDPHTGGLAGGLTGITTGAYDKRIGDREANVADLDAAGAALSNRVGSAKQRLGDLERRLAERTSSLQKMRAELQAIDKAIATARAGIAAQQGTLGSVEAENQRKNAVLTPLLTERNALARMVDELENNHRIQAQNYQRYKSTPGASPSSPANAGDDVQVAEMEKRLADFDQKQAEALERMKKVKILVAQAGM